MNAEKKILSSRQLATKIRNAQRRGARVVFTNGCFDLLHWGHVSYLERARKLGDFLIVAVNSDRSVRALKGPTRPINSLADRMRVLAGLESVTWVTSFDQDTPLQIIKLLRPNVLAKGADYRVSEMVGAPEVLSWGGKVRSVPLVKGRSTTGTLKRGKIFLSNRS